MAKAPKTPRRQPARRRQHAAPAEAPKPAAVVATPTKSTGGKVLGTATGVAAFTAVATALHGLPGDLPPQLVCGGTERWNIKVAQDADAIGGKVNTLATGPYSVSQMNQQMLPGPYPAGGRMDVEKKLYIVRGYLSYFKSETDKKGDRDYHVVITDQPGGYNENEQAAPNGKSMVVEFPDPHCFGGKTSAQLMASPLMQAVIDARATFEQHIKWSPHKKLTQPIPVTVTGVGFFDFDHHQEGRSTPHPATTGRDKVFELHPVTEISFDNDTDNG